MDWPQNTRVNFHRDEFRQGPTVHTLCVAIQTSAARAKYGTYGHTRHLETSADKPTKIDEDLGYAFSMEATIQLSNVR